MWKVEKGDTISFWYDYWIENHNPVDIMNISDRNIPDWNATVNEFIQQNAIWNISKLIQTLNNPLIIKKTQGIAIPIHNTKDSFCW